jgi:hypothetical protein
MAGILSDAPVGILDPRSAMLTQMGLGLLQAGGPSRTPVSFGQSFGQAGAQGLQAFQQANKANQEQQLYSLKMAEVQREAEERKKKETALAELLKDPRFAGMGPLLQVAPNAAIERAYPKDNRPMVVAPGASLVDPEKPEKPLFTAPPKAADDEFSRALTAAGIKEGTPEHTRLVQARLQKLTSNKPVAEVSVKVDNKTGESLAKPIGEMVQETRSMALGGLDQIDTGRRITQALDSGKVITGPGTKARVFLKQLGVTLGVAGKDDAEVLQNTRQVVKGLAEFTLGARKQLKGQGQVSDYEGRLIEKAASGEIDDMTEPEIRTVVGVADRLARKGYSLHQRNMDALRKNVDYAPLVDFYSVPELPGGSSFPTPPQDAIRRLRMNPKEAAQFDAVFGDGAAARALGR